MTNEPDTLARLVAYHDHIAVPPFEVADDVRRGRRRVRRNRGLLTGGVAVAVAGVAVAASLLQGGGLVDRSLPVAPQPTESSPSPMPTAGWTGPLRPGESLNTITMELGNYENSTDNVWTDPADAAFAGIDIREIQSEVSRPAWRLELLQAPPKASTLDPTRRIIEYGLVVDADGDRVADCQIGINNDAPNPGDYRVWVKNLKTGVTDERVGAPYGYPIEFKHPDEARPDDPGPEDAPYMLFTFLEGKTAPCDSFRDYEDFSVGVPSTNFYAWASITEDGQVTAWDYAPDAAWLAPS